MARATLGGRAENEAAWDPPSDRISKFLRNASNSAQMAVNGSVTPVDFYFQPNTSRDARLHRIVFYVRSAVAASPNEFGDISGGIATGLTLRIMDSGDSVVHDFLDGQTIKNNGDLAHYTSDVRNLGSDLTGDDIWISVWDFTDGGATVDFPAGHDWRFEITVSDDLSSLVNVEVLVQGHYH